MNYNVLPFPSLLLLLLLLLLLCVGGVVGSRLMQLRVNVTNAIADLHLCTSLFLLFFGIVFQVSFADNTNKPFTKVIEKLRISDLDPEES